MVHRNIHYEAAFEDYLRAKGLPYVAVDEAKRAIFGRVSLKSFDFIVYSEAGPNLLVDIKGRKFPDSGVGVKRGTTRAWENWVTRQDIEGLGEWQRVFGEDFKAILIFAYWLQGPVQRSPFEEVHFFRENHYAFAALSLDQYVTHAKPRSQKWQTLAMPAREFSVQSRDIAEFL